MKNEGRSLAEIADELGYESTKAVTRAINERYKLEAAFYSTAERQGILMMQLGRLDQMFTGVYTAARMGDPASSKIALGIIQEQNKLMQMYLPDASDQRETVLVLGGAENDYVEQLKKLADPDV